MVGRSGGESARGHDVHETFEPKHSSGNSYGSNDGGNDEDTDKIKVSSGGDKSNSGTLSTDGRNAGKSARGHDGNKTLEPKHGSGNSSGSTSGCNKEDTVKINDSSGTDKSNSGTLTTDGRSGGESVMGHDGNKPLSQSMVRVTALGRVMVATMK
eukprot:scaffold1314_cov25-Cyclotella_meneghiniana.AAC.1